jgi:hypothetical protein
MKYKNYPKPKLKVIFRPYKNNIDVKLEAILVSFRTCIGRPGMTEVMLASYFLCGQLLLFCDIEFEKKLRKNFFKV